jgi:hypothetical protein
MHRVSPIVNYLVSITIYRYYEYFKSPQRRLGKTGIPRELALVDGTDAEHRPSAPAACGVGGHAADATAQPALPYFVTMIFPSIFGWITHS